MEWFQHDEKETCLRFDAARHSLMELGDSMYDVIYVEPTYAVGFTMEEAMGVFVGLMQHICYGGRLLVAAYNRFGLQFFAGEPEPFSGKLFEGIGGLGEANLYTEKEWADGFAKPGLKVIQTYYPYPSLHDASEIFIKDSMWEHSYGRPYDEGRYERFHLFPEDMVIRQMMKDDTATYFANAFVFEIAVTKDIHARSYIEGDPAKRWMVYCKLNKNRTAAYRTMTAIYYLDGEMSVVKTPLTEEAQDHIARIHARESLFDNAYIKGLTGSLKDGVLTYPYIKTPSLNSMLCACMDEGDLEGIYRLIDGFYRVYFWNTKKSGHISPANMDLIFDNVFPTGDTYTIIDCEWVSEEPQLVDYVKFRGLHEFYFRYDKIRNMVDMESFFGHFGIDAEAGALYLQKSIRFVYDEVGVQTPDIGEDVAGLSGKENDSRTLESMLRNHLSVSLYYNTGEGYVQHQVLTDEIEAQRGSFTRRVSLPNPRQIRSIRIDPVENAFILGNAHIDLGERTDRMFAVNGLRLAGGDDFFLNGDPQFDYHMPAGFPEEITITGHFDILTPNEVAGILHNLGRKERKQLMKISKMIG